MENKITPSLIHGLTIQIVVLLSLLILGNDDSWDENNRSKSISFSEFFKQGKSKSKAKIDTMKTENLLSSLNINS